MSRMVGGVVQNHFSVSSGSKRNLTPRDDDDEVISVAPSKW